MADTSKDYAEKIAIIAENQEKTQEGLKHGTELFLKRMEAVGRDLSEHTLGKSWTADVAAAFSGTDEGENLSESLQEMAEKLTAEVPDVNTGMPQHPYLTPYNDYIKHAGNIPTFRIMGTLADIRTLENLLKERSLTPAQRGVTQKLLSALTAYAKNDPGAMAKELFIDKEQNSPANRAFNKMGQIGIVLAAGTAFLFTGGISILKGKPSVTPLFYGGTAALFMFPDLYKSLFGTKQQGAVDQFRRKISDPAMLKTAVTYNMKGPGWTNTFHQMNRPTTDVDAFSEKMENGTATDADMVLFANTMIPTMQDEEGNKNLLKVLRDDPEAFKKMRGFKDITEPEAVAAADYFFRSGAIEFSSKARQKKQEVEFKLEQMKQQQTTPEVNPEKMA